MRDTCARAIVRVSYEQRHWHGQHEEGVPFEEVDLWAASSSSSGRSLGVLIAAAVIVPLVILAGLFIWLKLTEEADEEALELEQEAGV